MLPLKGSSCVPEAEVVLLVHLPDDVADVVVVGEYLLHVDKALDLLVHLRVPRAYTQSDMFIILFGYPWNSRT